MSIFSKPAFSLAVGALTLFGLSAHPAAAQSALFDFDTDSIGTSGHAANTYTPCVDVSKGIGVSFTSSTPAGVNDPNGFFVYSGYSNPNFSGNILLANHYDSGVSGTFDHVLQTATFAFASGLPGTLTVQALRGGTLVGTATTGIVSSGLFTYSSSTFDTLVLKDTGAYLALDNLAVTAAPEPAQYTALSLGILGLIALVLGSARSRKKAIA